MQTQTLTTAFIVRFDAQILAGQIAPASLAIYNRDLAAYQTWASTDGDWLAAATFARWRAHLANETTLSPKTINRMLSAVKRVMDEAAVQGYLSREIAETFGDVKGVKVKAMKERTKTTARTRITPADMRRICEAPSSTTLTGIRDRALLLTLASSGCRISEVVSLTAPQIQRKGKGYLLTVMGKNQEEPRDAPLSPEAYEAIQAWLIARTKTIGAWQPIIFTGIQGRSQQPLATALDPASAWKAVQKYAAAAGMAHIKPHDFRRFVGTQLAQTDIRKAQKALGHKSIETTARHYVLDELEPGLTDRLF
jgi:integrase/recombinase XerD